MIQCAGVSKSFTTNNQTSVIYDKLNREVAEGQSVAIMGPSGSGKSTLLNLLSGLDTPDEGTIVIKNQIISQLQENDRTRRRAKNIGFIFQQFHLIPNLTIKDNIDLVIDISGVERRFETSVLLEKVGLTGYGGRYPHELSGGEQQRVAVARTFVGKLPILLADEPTGNLDHKNAIMIMELMMQLHRDSGTTVIIITHDSSIAKYAQLQYELIEGVLQLVN